MQHVLKNSSPSTYSIEFFDYENKFVIKDSKDKVYYYRYLPDGMKEIKVNIPDKGSFYFSKNAVVSRKPLSVLKEIKNITLPRPERNRERDYFITHDENETASPALIYTKTGKIVTGRKFKDLSIPMRIFILLHEVGHFKYKTEKYCDLYAFVEFVKMGYNPSTAMYCLTDVLKRKPENDERINYMYDKLMQAEIIK